MFLFHLTDGNWGMKTEVKKLEGHPAVSVRTGTQTQGVCVHSLYSFFSFFSCQTASQISVKTLLPTAASRLCVWWVWPPGMPMHAFILVKHGQCEVRDQLLMSFLRAIHLGFCFVSFSLRLRCWWLGKTCEPAIPRDSHPSHTHPSPAPPPQSWEVPGIQSKLLMFIQQACTDWDISPAHWSYFLKQELRNLSQTPWTHLILSEQSQAW